MSFESALGDITNMLDQNLLVAARSEADPVTFLNLQFAINEKNRKEGLEPTRRLTFQEILKTQRETYYQELGKKTTWAFQERKRLYNEWASRYIVGGRDYLKNYDAVSGMQGADTPLYFQNLKNSLTPPHNTWGHVLKKLTGPGVHTVVLMKFAFPSVHAYRANPEGYPYFVDFMENHPFPSAELMDLAAKKACKYGTDEYEEEMFEYIKFINETNLDDNTWIHYYFLRPHWGKYCRPNDTINYFSVETHFGRPKENPGFVLNSTTNYLGNSHPYWQKKNYDPVFFKVAGENYIQNSYCPFERRNSSSEWWWPRPRPGFVYVAKVGFIHPRFMLPQYIFSILSAYGYQEAEKDRIRREQARAAERRSRGGLLGNFFRGVMDAASTGDPWKSVGATVGGLYSVVRPNSVLNDFMKSNNLTKDMYREIDAVSGGLVTQVDLVSDIPAKWIRGEAVTEQDLMMALDLGIKGAVIAASGGSAAAVIGTVSSQLQRGSWGEDEFGSLVLQMGEVAAIAYAAGAGVDEVVGELAERVVVDQAKQTIYKQTDLDETMLGTFVVELGTTSGARVYNGQGVVDAVLSGADKSAALAIAKESPEAAMLLGAVLAVRRSGIHSFYQNADTDTDPESWFDNFSWEQLGKDLGTAWKNIDSKTRKQIIGITIMVAAGKLKAEDGLKILGQQIAMRQIEKFYEGQPITSPSSREMAERAKMLAEVRKIQAEESALQKIRQGKIPSPGELKALADGDTISWAWDSITSLVPTEAQVDAWSMQFKMGFPDWSIDTPNLNLNLSVPDWAKVGSVDMPEWSKIKVKEEWRNKLRDSLEKKKQKIISKLQWENILHAFLVSLWPPNVPLRPVGSRHPYDYNYIDSSGVLRVRKPLRFPYDHPMLAHGVIKRKYTQDEQAYMDERDREIKQLVAEYERMTGESLDQTTIGLG